ncbi:MAG TPA: large-conductance mechanosensitive channel protein MscL [Caulobacteraceae bacterium]|nr:large-conductance mechanosensitive channel protein MscL [Caulobacteraceae bacterium]
MSIFKEFRDFIGRGNVVDLAVAVVIGAAFGKIITSLVNDIIMPPVGLLTGGMDFSALKAVIKPGDPARKIAEVSINYGAFINTIITFVIIAAAIFLMIRLINSLQKPEHPDEAPAPGPTPTEALLTEIRNLLANRG